MLWFEYDRVEHHALQQAHINLQWTEKTGKIQQYQTKL